MNAIAPLPPAVKYRALDEARVEKFAALRVAEFKKIAEATAELERLALAERREAEALKAMLGDTVSPEPAPKRARKPKSKPKTKRAKK